MSDVHCRRQNVAVGNAINSAAMPCRQAAASAAVPEPQSKLASLTGQWTKNKAASDDMQEACDALHLPWLLRKALGFLNTLEVQEPTVHLHLRQ